VLEVGGVEDGGSRLGVIIVADVGTKEFPPVEGPVSEFDALEVDGITVHSACAAR
jgi:hypothetical protein